MTMRTRVAVAGSCLALLVGCASSGDAVDAGGLLAHPPDGGSTGLQDGATPPTTDSGYAPGDDAPASPTDDSGTGMDGAGGGSDALGGDAASSPDGDGAACGLQSCLFGCCAPDGTCAAGTSATACGSAGNACTDCTATQETCSAGACVSASDAGTSGDGAANMCTTKICVDPVFDCPLQGCFNGCTGAFGHCL